MPQNEIFNADREKSTNHVRGVLENININLGLRNKLPIFINIESIVTTDL